MLFNAENYMKRLISCKDDSERQDTIRHILKENHLEYEDNTFSYFFTNIICKGSSDIWLSAHYDTVNNKYCANDNTASLINMLYLKLLVPEVNIVFLDAEEPPHMGLGSEYFSYYIRNNNIPCRYIINLELTGFGENIMIGTIEKTFNSALYEKILTKIPNSSAVFCPFSDATIFRGCGIDSIVLFTMPSKNNKIITEAMYYCHTPKDNIDIINYKDMENLVTTLKNFLEGELLND